MKVLVISGGRHPYEESTPILESFLNGAGHDVTVTEDASPLADRSAMSGYDALVFNTRRENVPDFGDWTLSESQMQGLKDYVSGGGGFVCIHIATCVAAAWPEYHDITGGGWISGTSYHPPYGEFTVNVSQAGHPGASGIADFSTNGRALHEPGDQGRQQRLHHRDRRGRHLALGAGPEPHPHAGRDLSVGMDAQVRRRQRLHAAAGP